MAEQFLAALSPDAAYTFQTFAEGKGRSRLSRILHGTLASKGRQLAALNEKGAGVFVMVNRGDGNGRRADNVVGCRALFLDLDGAPLEPVMEAPIPPRIVVESSPGKWHAYWPVADLPSEQFTAAQKALALRFDGDPKVHDRPRVMRLPGFVHRKGAPFLTRLHTCQRAPLTWQEMADAFAFTDRMKLPATIAAGERNATLFKLARSGAAKGVPEAEQLAKLRTVNAERCADPLDDAELRQIVASGYRTASQGAMSIPLAVIDSEAYKALDDASRTLLLLSYRRADKFNAFTLPHKEMREWFPRKDTFNAVRKRLVKSGLLNLTQAPEKRMPRQGRGPKAGFYRLSIGPFCVAYSDAQIGPLSVAPEAFQVSTVEAPSGERLRTTRNLEPERAARAPDHNGAAS